MGNLLAPSPKSDSHPVNPLATETGGSIKLNPVYNTPEVINNRFHNSQYGMSISMAPQFIVHLQGNSQAYALTSTPRQRVNGHYIQPSMSVPRPLLDLPDNRQQRFTGDQ
jgi:hypothetical protein